jgi:methionyl-tRNA formyltransferase
MKISFLCSDASHPVNAYLDRWISANVARHDITLARRKADLSGGDILFLVSCHEIIHDKVRASYRFTLVLHASDLPLGRGWSPHVWSILNGADTITLTLLEADEKVDSGRILRKLTIPVPKHALWNEINALIFWAEITLIDFAVDQIDQITPTVQGADVEPTYFRRRTPEDSRLDPNQSLAMQFDQIRVCDPNRFPAFFELHGYRYKLTLEKMHDEPDYH